MFKKLIFFIAILSSLPIFARADFLYQNQNFYVDPTYDFQKREKVSATLRKISDRAYFYVEDNWFLSLEEKERDEVMNALEKLASKFDEIIYPKLTLTFGSEWSPGIDNDYRITVLFHRMKEEAGGYFNSGDEYPKIQNPKSNQREMIYINTLHLLKPTIDSYLAHEFVHLITFNQKTRIFNIEEETWLNEARAEIVPTLLGFEEEFSGSNLEQRVKYFLKNPSDSLTEWQNERKDYAVINLFSQYLLDHYGVNIFRDSLQSSKTGIESINEALRKNGFSEDFGEVFTNWTITLFLNDCQVSPKYCYKNKHLQNLRINPLLIFLPLAQQTETTLSYSIKEWSANWYRIFGGEGELTVEFFGSQNAKFKIPYLLCVESACQVKFLELNQANQGKIIVSNSAKNWNVVLIPSVQKKISNFSSFEPFYNFSLKISLSSKKEEDQRILQLQKQIEELKKQIAFYQQKLNENPPRQEEISCRKLEKNLYFGLRDSEVKCLQQFLKNQGAEIYPEGLVTGYFGPLTLSAVKRFQQKYWQEILAPWGLTKDQPTGFVGPTTRSKINQLLASQAP